ncbi:MAG: SurA N-terminal domain-containing protein [Bordetella sp.]|nr:MAG: SurA N-terminal domain-containing protein [Bordetella sp.]
MLHNTKKYHKWIKFIVALLIIPSFLLIGLNSYQNLFDKEKKLAKIGNLTITLSEFQRVYDNYIKKLYQNNELNFELLDKTQIKQDVLDEIIDKYILDLAVIDYKIDVSNEKLRKFISELDWGNGKNNFSIEKYSNFLKSYNLTSAEFENNQRHQLSIHRLIDPIMASVYVPKNTVDIYKKALLEKRTIRLKKYKASDFESLVSINPQDLQLWYKDHKNQLEIPQTIDIAYILIDKKEIQKNQKINDLDVFDFYLKNSEKFIIPETRCFSSIFIDSPLTSDVQNRQEAYDKSLKLSKLAKANPENFHNLANENSNDTTSCLNGGDLGTWNSLDLNRIMGHAIQKTIFELDKEDISDVIETSLGFYILKVTNINKEEIIPFSEVREKIESDIIEKIVSDQFLSTIDQLSDLIYEEDFDLQSVANAIGSKIYYLDGLARNGKIYSSVHVNSNYNNFFESKHILDILFSKEMLEKTNQHSGIIEISPSVFMIACINKLNQASIPSLEQANTEIVKKIIIERSTELAKKEGEKLLKVLELNQDPNNYDFLDSIKISRLKSENKLSKEIFDMVMNIRTNSFPICSGLNENSDFIVVCLDSIDFDYNEDEAIQTSIREKLSHIFEIVEIKTVLREFRKKYKTKMFLDENFYSIN